jgi:ADP-ribose pyrophosphatase YjhB (NUDIX family)
MSTLMHVSLHVPGCPRCAAREEQPLVCERCHWRWYANPKPAAAVLLERAGNPEPSVLLLRRAVEPGRGAWDLPAGYLDPGESFEQAARRETQEESGLEVELIGLAGVYHSPSANAVTAVFRARQTDPDATVRLDFESSDHAWVARSDVAGWLPRVAFRSMANALADWAGLSRR